MSDRHAVRYIYERDLLQGYKKYWSILLKNGTANRAELIDFILTIDECGSGTIPMSVGMEWITANPEEFQKVVGNVDEFIEQCLELIDQDPTNEGTGALRWWFFKTFICNEKLMSLLSPAWRELWIEELYPQLGANSSEWISTAILTGIPREKIAKAILLELEKTPVREGCSNTIESFLQHGGGNRNEAPVHRALWSLGFTQKELDQFRTRLEQDPSNGFPEIEALLKRGIKPTNNDFFGGCFPPISPWWVLSNDELQKALKICAGKVPGKTMSVLDDERIDSRLNEAGFEEIISCVVEHMTSLNGISVKKLETYLDLSARERLARRLEPVEKHASYAHRPISEFLLGIITELPKKERREFWVDVIEVVLKNVSPIDLYCIWRQLKLEEKNVETTLTRSLTEKGVCKGVIKRVPNPKGGMQFAVEIDGLCYVQSRDQHRYFPTEGEEVLFSRNGMRLTPYVIAVYFTPVMREVKD